jgi:hypothetical protein
MDRIYRKFSHLVHLVNPVEKVFGQDKQDLQDETAREDRRRAGQALAPPLRPWRFNSKIAFSE